MRAFWLCVLVLVSGCAATSDKIIEDAKRSDVEFMDQHRAVKLHTEAARDEGIAHDIDRAYIEALDAQEKKPRRKWPTEYGAGEGQDYGTPETLLDVYARLYQNIGDRNRVADIAGDTREIRLEDHGNLKVEWAREIVMAVGDCPWWMQLVIQIVRPVQRMIAEFKWKAEQQKRAEAKEKQEKQHQLDKK